MAMEKLSQPGGNAIDRTLPLNLFFATRQMPTLRELKRCNDLQGSRHNTQALPRHYPGIAQALPRHDPGITQA
jgi:hypothetical protein